MKTGFLNKHVLYLRSHSHFIFSFLLVLCASLFTARTLFQQALPLTYDIHHHAARVANYYLALTQGQFPPRLAPNLVSGFGSPVFIFMYPLPYILATPFFILTNSIELSVNLVIVVSIVLAFTGAWFLGFFLTRKAFPSLIVSLLYGLSPYFLVVIFVKGAIAEALFMGILPWVWFFLLSYKQQKQLWWQIGAFISFLFLMLSHHLSIVVVAPLIFFWMILKFHKDFLTKTRSFLLDNMRLWVVGLSSVMTSLFFWIPMILEKGNTVIDENKTVAGYANDFVSINKLIWSTAENTMTLLGVFNEKFSLMLGIPVLVIILLGVLALLWQRKKLMKSSDLIWLIFWLFIVFSSIFLMLPQSKFLWELYKPLRYLQFPWRLLWLSVFGSSMIYLYAEKAGLWGKVSSFLVASSVLFFAGIGLLFWSRAIDSFSNGNSAWFEYPYSSTSYNELNPKWVDLLFNHRITTPVFLRPLNKKSFESELQIEPNTIGEAKIDLWNGTTKMYQITLPEDGDIIQRTFFYPGWEAWIDGKKVPIDYRDQEFRGRIVLHTSAGSHSVKVQWTNNVLHRHIADALSIGGLVLFVGLLIFQMLFQLKSKKFVKII